MDIMLVRPVVYLLFLSSFTFTANFFANLFKYSLLAGMLWASAHDGIKPTAKLSIFFILENNFLSELRFSKSLDAIIASKETAFVLEYVFKYSNNCAYNSRFQGHLYLATDLSSITIKTVSLFFKFDALKFLVM